MQQRTWALVGAGLIVALGVGWTLRGGDAEAALGLEVETAAPGGGEGLLLEEDSTLTAAPETEERLSSQRSAVDTAEAGLAEPVSPASAQLRGIIESENGGPCANARVLLKGSFDGPTRTLRADGRGHFDGDALPPGPYSINVQADGHLARTTELTLDPGGEHDLTVLILRAARRLRGRVIDEQGQGIAGAQLLHIPEPEGSKGVTLTPLGRTGAGGAFELASLPRHTLRLGVIAPDRPPVTTRVTAAQADVEIVVPDGWGLLVRVIDIPAECPPLRLTVSPSTGSPSASDEGDWRLQTRRNWPLGLADQVELRGLLLATEYDLTLEANWQDDQWGPCAEPVHVQPNTGEATIGPPQMSFRYVPEQPEGTAKAGPLSSILVEVQDPSGLPATSATVLLLAPKDAADSVLQQVASERTDWLGRARFTGLPPGPYALRPRQSTPLGRRLMRGGSVAQVSLGHNDPNPEAVHCTTAANEQTEVTLVIDALLPIAGVVLEGGLPVPNASIQFLDHGADLPNVLAFADLGAPEATTSAEGRFRLPRTRVGECTLIVESPGRPVPHAEHLVVCSDTGNLTVRLPTGSLGGTVRSSTGAPIGGANVRIFVRHLDGSYQRAPQIVLLDHSGAVSMVEPDLAAGGVQTASTGQYLIEGVPAQATLHLVVSAEGHRKVEGSVVTETRMDHELDFTLEAGGQLKVRVVDVEGKLVQNCTVKLAWRGDSEREPETQFAGGGVCTFEDLFPGPWEMTAKHFEDDRKSNPVELTIQSGETSQAEARLP